MFKDKTVLVIEDNPMYAKIVGKRLALEGLSVVNARDGLEGFNLARKISPDLIVLDLMLPTMDGHKVCRLLKFDRNCKDIPIVILTSRDTEADAELAEYSRADAFLAKTVKGAVMMDVVSRLLEAASRYEVEKVVFEGETLDILKCKTVA